MAFGKSSREEIVQLAENHDWTVEFSSSFPHMPDMVEFFKTIKINRFAHNYFPAPEKPFVLNLASKNREVRINSIEHCLQGLRISKVTGAHCFSAHAGFCIDPDPEMLGNALNVDQPIDRNLNWTLFLESVNEIIKEAKKLNMSFYIENNVTAPFNIREDGQEVLLCSSAEELILLSDAIDKKNFGILLDTAHLKISSNALDFDKDQAVKKLMPYIKYIHHSDNNGEKDTNDSIDPNYWFLKWMKHFIDATHILEVKNIGVKEISTQLSLLKNHG